uniref:(northern house mosquito) hypothetical protein n=1 Tax=Culex pipiens TaxID=7175 RepID=A0A8D8FTF5_CULPI
MQGIDREEPRDLLAVFVYVLQQDAVGPDAQPGVNAFGADGPLRGVQAAQRLLNALQAILALPGHGTTEVQYTTATDWCRVPHVSFFHTDRSTVLDPFQLTRAELVCVSQNLCLT